MQTINDVLNLLIGLLWGPPMLVLLMGTHLFFTFRLRFIQRHIGRGIRLSVARERAEGDVSPFGALSTALAATVGTGNIVGVATAVALGGPGAVLWCWLTGVFGIATKYAEGLLAVKYRVITADGTHLGGPMYALEKGLGLKWLGVVFAVFTVIASFGIGNMTQANALAELMKQNFNLAPWVCGTVTAALTAAVILGGIRSIARACAVLVPLMGLVYCLGCIVILVMTAGTLPETLRTILSSAFTGRAAAGGFAGATLAQALRYGIARGLFSNESGMGSAPIAAAAARARNPVRQALVSATGTFWDTVVICAMTGLVVVNCGDWRGGATGAALTQSAFAVLPGVGPAILTFGLATFVFSTLIGWSYYGERALEYLGGKKTILPYRLLWVVMIVVGARSSMPVVWNFADVANALMAIPNLLALLLLSGVVVRETRRYLWEGRLDELPPDAEAGPGDSPPR